MKLVRLCLAAALLCCLVAAWFFHRGLNPKLAPVKVLQSELTFATAGTPSGGQQLKYKLVLELETEDDAKRRFRWSLDTGAAIYPEEALDVLADWAPGKRYEIRPELTQASQLRFTDPFDTPEILTAFHWLFLGFAAAACAIPLRALQHPPLPIRLSMVLLGVAALFYGLHGLALDTWDFLDRVPVQVRLLAQGVQYDFSKPVEHVKYEESAVAFIRDWTYDLYQYQLDGKQYRLGAGKPWGVLSSARIAEPGRPDSNRFHLNPANRWDLSRNFSWWTAAFWPNVEEILGGLGLILLGVVIQSR